MLFKKKLFVIILLCLSILTKTANGNSCTEEYTASATLAYMDTLKIHLGVMEDDCKLYWSINSSNPLIEIFIGLTIHENVTSGLLHGRLLGYFQWESKGSTVLLAHENYTFSCLHTDELFELDVTTVSIACCILPIVESTTMNGWSSIILISSLILISVIFKLGKSKIIN